MPTPVPEADLDAEWLLSAWLQIRCEMDDLVDELTAFGPLADARVSDQLPVLERLDAEARERFRAYRDLAQGRHPRT